MFLPTSRYAALETAVYELPGGRKLLYKRRRLLPQGDDLPLLTEVTVRVGDRLDRVTARTLGDPELFWRIADANDALDPRELTAEPGRRLRVPRPAL